MAVPKQFVMSKDTLLEIVSFVKQLNVSQVSFTIQGLGEPLLNNTLFSSLQLIKKIYPNSPINITSNGTLLGTDLIGQIDNLLVSLNFSNDVSYLKHNKESYYDLVVEKLKLFLKAKGSLFPNTSIQMLDMPENNWMQFKNDWLPYLNRNDNVTLHSMNEWNNSTLSLSNRHPCMRLWNQIYFGVEGDIYPCCLGEVAEDLKLGNIHTELNFIKLKHLQHVHKSGCYEVIASCGACHVWNEMSCPFLKVGNKWF
jgi:radical SAM protein with 4Fe4S-binding SPASM domain